MLRSGHVFYDLRETLSSSKFLIGVLVITSFFVLFVNLQCVYGVVLLFVALFAARGLIGRRCPKCDTGLKEIGSEKDKDDAFTLYVIWRCPNDGYEEKEKIKGSGGLFGAN